MTINTFFSSFFRRSLLVLAALIVAALLIYCHNFQSPFVLDGTARILENSQIRMTEFSPTIIKNVLRDRRPLAFLTFALNYYFNRYQVFGYHVVNITIHIITAFLVYLLAYLTVSINNRPGSKKYGLTLIPFLTALLWLVHPLHIQSVTYIVQRMNALAALFYLLSLVCYIRARLIQRRGDGEKAGVVLFFTLAALSAVLAIASKEIAATLPVMIFLYECLFFWQPNRWGMKKFLICAGLIIVLVAVVSTIVFMHSGFWQWNQAGYEKQPFTMSERLMTEPLVVIYYLTLLLFPHPDRLNFIYDFPVSKALFNPMVTVLAITALAALLIWAAFIARRDRLICFAVIWFLGTLVIESSIISLQLVFEHRTYLPSVFPIMVLVLLAAENFKSRVLTILIFCAVIALFGTWTYQRNLIWRDEISIWRDCASKTPLHAGPYNNLGHSLMCANNGLEAIRYLSRALEIEPYNEAIHNNIAAAYLMVGNYEKALHHCQEAITINPESFKAINTKGMILNKLGRLQEAADCFQQVITIKPDSLEAMMNLAKTMEQQRRYAKAVEVLRNAVAVNPTDKEAHYYLGKNLAMAARPDMPPDEAVNQLSEAVLIDPQYALAHNALANVYLLLQDIPAAIEHYQHALDINPDFPAVAVNLANVYNRINQPGKAISTLKQAVNRQPDNPELLLNLTQLLIQTDQLDEAIVYMEHLSRIKPDVPTISYNLACLYARQNEIEPAVSSLKKAIENGYNNWRHLQTDPDLKNIYHTEYYQELSGKWAE